MNSTMNIVSWAAEPEGRGTVGLLWSCFATVFLSTWNALHPNLPALREGNCAILRRRVAYVMACLVAPEIYAFSALAEVVSATRLKARIPGWSLKKCFFLQMGGFVVQDGSHPDSQCRRVDPEKLLALIQNKSLTWPELSDEEIQDRSKADWTIKAAALIQILWFVTQIIGRWAQGLAVTTLELFTLGIVASAVVIYVALWEKPFDVQMPVLIQNKDAIHINVADCSDSVGLLEWDKIESVWYMCAGIVICLVFGALHVAAWKFHFPSFVEQLLWRISSIGIMVLPVIIVTRSFANFDSDFAADWSVFVSYGSGVVYALFRLYMFVEMFASLRAVPASVYQTPQWSQYFPAFG